MSEIQDTANNYSESSENGDSTFSNDVLLEFRHISKNYGAFTALNDVNFSLKRGEVFGYIGPNGAGKTTTMKIIVGLIRNYSGQILLNGHPINKVENNIYTLLGYLPQDVGFQTWRTVEHLLDTFGRLSGYDPALLPQRIDEVLELVGLQDVKSKKIVHLSGGMQQKLRLAQALLHKPQFLVLDEPMTGLDPSSRYQMKNIIRELVKQDITIFLSSHILSDIQDISDRIGIINKGQILNIGTPQELQAKFRVGDEVEITFAENHPACPGIENLPCVQTVKSFGKLRYRLILTTEGDLDQHLQDILKFLIENNCKVRNFNLMQPSLEDVYLRYVEEGN